MYYLYKVGNIVVAGKQSNNPLPPPAELVSKEEYLKAGFCVKEMTETETLSQQLTYFKKENQLLKAQLQAQTDRAEFIEDCIAEMAIQVYETV